MTSSCLLTFLQHHSSVLFDLIIWFPVRNIPAFLVLLRLIPEILVDEALFRIKTLLTSNITSTTSTSTSTTSSKSQIATYPSPNNHLQALRILMLLPVAEWDGVLDEHQMEILMSGTRHEDALVRRRVSRWNTSVGGFWGGNPLPSLFP